MADEQKRENLEISLELLKTALKLSPVLIDWLQGLLGGDKNPMELRVGDILKPESESEKALKDLTRNTT